MTKINKNIISIKKLLAAIFVIFAVTTLAAQRPNPQPLNSSTPQDTSSKKVTIDFADTLDLIQENGELIQKLLGNVELRQDSVYMYCDSAIITNSNQVVAQGNVIIQQGDSLNVFADSLNYDGEQKKATLYSKVVLDSKGQQLFTEELDYDRAWVPDSQMIWSDCYSILALAAVNTSRIHIGTGVSIAGTRIAPVTAHSIGSINQLAPGRVPDLRRYRRKAALRRAAGGPQ